MPTTHLGMRGTGDWADNQRPENWRESILYLYPNGSAPLTAIMSMFSSQSTDDPVYHWWTKGLPKQAADVTGIFKDVALDTAYSSGDNYTDDQTVYVQVSAEQAGEFRVGHQALLRDNSDYRVDTNSKVTDVVIDGANSYIACKLREDANTNADLDSVDKLLIVGNINPEGGTMPDSVSYDPVEYFNNTQIWRTPLEITRTARKTRLRTGDAYKEEKREALELHSIEMEKSLIWGARSSKMGSNNKPERTTNGIIRFITANAQQNVDDYTTNEDYDGQSWLQGGEEWLDDRLERIFRYGRTTKLALVGSGTLLAINQLAKASGHINLEPMTIEYGIQVVRWLTPFGTILLKLHPLFSYELSNRNSMLVIEPEKLKWRFIDDTYFVEDPQDRRNRNHSLDGTQEEYITEGGLELHHPLAFGYLNGFGQANPE